jgi:hypothetical protein
VAALWSRAAIETSKIQPARDFLASFDFRILQQYPPIAVIQRMSANRFSGLAAQLCSEPPDFHLCSSVQIRFGETGYMTGTAYLAGPDVFLPNAVAHAATKVEICRRLGLRGLPPLNENAETTGTELEVWQAIYEKDVAMMENSDIIIANLTPFQAHPAATRLATTVTQFSPAVTMS